MTSSGKRLRLVNLILAVAAILSTGFGITRKGNSNSPSLEDLPMLIGDFTGIELPVDQSVRDILETPNVLMRNYAGPDNVNVAVAIVYYENYRVSFHMPEGCMVGLGSAIIATGKESIGELDGYPQPIVANKLVLKRPKGRQQVFYLFVTDNLVTPSYTKMRLYMMAKRLRNRQVGAALVRFSTELSGEDSQQSAIFKDFVVQLLDRLLSNTS